MRGWNRMMWERLSPLLDRALDLEPGDRRRFLMEIQAQDPDAGAALERLLAEHDQVVASSFLETPLIALEPASLAGQNAAATRSNRSSRGRFESAAAGKLFADTEDEMSEPANHHAVVIAIINSSDDTVEMLRTCLHREGFSSIVTGHIDDIKHGRTDFVDFLERHDPRVLVYDISIPYEENWKFLRLLMSSDEMDGRRVVMTTTNKKVLESFVGKTDTIEIHGKPYDLGEIVKSVTTAAAAVTRRAL